MNTRQVGILKDGMKVYERPRSHASSAQQNILELVYEMCAHVLSGEDFIVYTHDFGRVIGDTICVETYDADEIIYAVRLHRKGKTRFVKGKRPIPSTKVTMVLMRDKGSALPQYILITAYVGEAAPPEPWDTHASAHARMFWDTHALVWDSVPVVPGSETAVCPW